ncbi:MAG: Jag N-terminal domain-containing protein [Anaerolineales bacterium]|nr:MAG: Jag N-terminal domain-containing protein [Anaerolineales bacterium]
MGNNRTTLEVIAPTIEEAIANGLQDLGLTQDQVDIEILDEGSRGLFGLGTRQARVRLSLKTPPKVDQKPSTVTSVDQAPLEELEELDLDEIESEMEAFDFGEEQEQESALTPVEVDFEYILEIAEDTVIELLKKMKVVAQVTAHLDDDNEYRGRPIVHVDINGKDLSILIGRQAETLTALQYISSLIVGKELGRSVTLVLDVEGYRKRREQQLRQLARRMADQALKTGRRQVLEPMPANERRLIHIELRENSSVKTESIGEEPRRKVTIIPT